MQGHNKHKYRRVHDFEMCEVETRRVEQTFVADIVENHIANMLEFTNCEYVGKSSLQRFGAHNAHIFENTVNDKANNQTKGNIFFVRVFRLYLGTVLYILCLLL